MNFLNKVIFGLLYLLAFLLPIQTRFIIRPGFINFGYWEYGTFSIYISDIILLLVFSFLFVALAMGQKEFINLSFKKSHSKYLFFVLGLELIAFLSIFFAYNKILSLYRFGILLLALGLFLVVKNLKGLSKVKLIYSFLAGAFLQALLAIWQFISQSTFAFKYLGLAEHNPATAGVSVIEIYKNGEPLRWLRAYGGLDHPNMLGAVLAIAILLTVGLIIERRQLHLGNRDRHLFFGINYSLLFVFAVALLFSFSRSAWLATALGLILILAVNFRKIFGQKISFKLLETKLIVIFCTLFLVIFAWVFNLVEVRFNQQNRLEKISTNERLAGLTYTQEIIQDRPWFGQGIGNYTLAVFWKTPYQPSWYYQPVHNTFLLIFSEIGILGFLCFVGILLLAVNRQVIFFRNHEVGLAIIVALLVILMVDHWLWSLHFGLLFFWFILGLTLTDENPVL